MTKIARDMLSVAAEFAVASELGRRNVYAQPTFGHLKRTDLLIFGKSGNLLRIKVKGKQGQQWPNCKGIADENSVLVLVDFHGKHETERPDFYVLTVSDWLAFIKREIKKRQDKRIELDSENVPVWTNQVNKAGQPYRGMGVEVRQVARHKERWDKITSALGEHR